MLNVIHTTIGVYKSGKFKMNGVEAVHLESHIAYNKENRWGRALFVDGECVYAGYFTEKEVSDYTRLFKSDKKRFTITKDTKPYH